MYTPTHIDEIDVMKLKMDRPYAAWLFAGVSLDLMSYFQPWRLNWIPGDHPLTTWSWDLQFGPLGPGAEGEAVQTGWHTFRRVSNGYSTLPKNPLGWHLNHIEEETGVNLRSSYSIEYFRMTPSCLQGLGSRTWSDPGIRVTPGIYADVGNVMDQAGLTLSFRGGLIGGTQDKPISPTKAATALFSGEHGTSHPPSSRRSSAIELFGYLTLDGRANVYNYFLDGKSVSDGPNGPINPTRLRRSTEDHLVADVSYGFVAKLWGVVLDVGTVWRSREFPNPEDSGRHHFAQCQLGFLF
jgi:hypothetical protein